MPFCSHLMRKVRENQNTQEEEVYESLDRTIPLSSIRIGIIR